MNEQTHDDLWNRPRKTVNGKTVQGMKPASFFLSFLCAFLSCACPQKEKDIRKETYLYAVKGTDSLYLDRYTDTAVTKPEACVIFLFGGGFVRGRRDAEQYRHYFNTLAASGYTVISIDYRSGLKNAGKESFATPEQFLSLLKQAIDLAVEDLYDATGYVLSRPEWRIDPGRIILSGSSAGAVTVLQAEYEIITRSVPARKLPEGFNFAAVISFAGAIASLDGDLTLNDKTCPVMLFHGDADSNVPCDKIELGPAGFYGSGHIAKKMKEHGLPCCFYRITNAAHEIAETPMNENTDEIKTFIDRFVLQQQPLFMESVVERIGKPELKKDFEPNDYIISNYGN
jgi:acetyl esterase/lipase